MSRKPRIVTVTNQKGGSGKTTLALHLAWLAAERDAKVLVVDFDSQGNASFTLTHDAGVINEPRGAETLLVGNSLAIRSTQYEGIDLLHGHQRLDSLDAELANADLLKVRKHVLDALQALEYDMVIIDTPPALSIRQILPMVIADVLVCPVQPDPYAVSGLTNTLARASEARSLNPRMQIAVVVNKIRAGDRHAKVYVEALETLGELRRPFLYDRAAVGGAIVQHKPVWKYARAAAATKRDWRELMEAL